MSGTALKPIDEVRNAIERMGPQFKAALPQHVTPEKFMRVAMTAINSTPALLDANRTTLYSAIMKCAQDGLVPDGREAALTTFRTKDQGVVVQYMPMVAGILKKVRNSGELKTIGAHVVYTADAFDYYIDDEGEHLTFRPLLDGDRGKPRLTFAQALTKDGGVYVEVLTEGQVQAIKAVSRAQNGPWSGPFADEMRRKSAIRRLAKRLPMSTDIEEFMRTDDDLFDPPEPEAATSGGPPPPQPTPAGAAAKPKGSRLRDRVLDKTPEPIDVQPQEPAPETAAEPHQAAQEARQDAQPAGDMI